MSSWRKLLVQMAADTDPRNYAYEDAVRVLVGLGFSPAKSKPSGSHRVWRRPDPGGNVHATLVVALKDAGSGTMKPAYIRDMVKILDSAGLIPREGGTQ